MTGSTTEPTQAQIDALKERVDKFMMLALPGQPQMMHMGTSYLIDDLWNALAAAAQMGKPEYEYIDGQAVAKVTGPTQVDIENDPRWMQIAGQGVQTEFQLRKEMLTLEAATIERCAQAVETFNPTLASNPSWEAIHLVRDIAAAIRALANPPPSSVNMWDDMKP